MSNQNEKYDWKKAKIGTLWNGKARQDGLQQFTGNIEIEGKTYYVHVFPFTYQTDNQNPPAFTIHISPPRDNQNNQQAPQALPAQAAAKNNTRQVAPQQAPAAQPQRRFQAPRAVQAPTPVQNQAVSPDDANL